MIVGERVILRPIIEGDWETIAEWGADRMAWWGPYRRFQMDQLDRLRKSLESGITLTREMGFLLIETREVGQLVGFVSYTAIPFPDRDLPHLSIDFGIARIERRGEGLAQEAVALLVDYLLGGNPVERITAVIEIQDQPSRDILERCGFEREGVMRRATYRDGVWRDCALYAILRKDWLERKQEGRSPGTGKEAEQETQARS